MLKTADWLTVSRVILTPIIAWLWIAAPLTLHWLGLWIFIAAGLTDAADGRIARHFKQTTRFGSYMDPFADKILVLGTAAVLVYDHRLAVWWFFLVLARELSVTTLRSVLKPGVSMPAVRAAKWKTLTQLFAVGAAAVLSGLLPLGLAVLSAVLTVWTGIEYIRRFWPVIDI